MDQFFGEGCLVGDRVRKPGAWWRDCFGSQNKALVDVYLVGDLKHQLDVVLECVRHSHRYFVITVIIAGWWFGT